MAVHSFNTNFKRYTDLNQLNCFRNPLNECSHHKRQICQGLTGTSSWSFRAAAEMASEKNHWNNPKMSLNAIWRSVKPKCALAKTHRWKRFPTSIFTPRVPYTQLYSSTLGRIETSPSLHCLSPSLWNSCMSLVACPITGFNPPHQQTKPPSAIKDPLVPLLQSEIILLSSQSMRFVSLTFFPLANKAEAKSRWYCSLIFFLWLWENTSLFGGTVGMNDI